MHRRTLLSLGAVVVLALGLHGPSTSQPAFDNTLSVGVLGCDQLTAEPRCIRAQPGPIALWWGEDASLEVPTVSFGGAPLGEDRVTVDASHHGALFEIDPPAEEGLLTLAHPDGRRFTVALSSRSPALTRMRQELLDLLEQGGAAATRQRLDELRGEADEATAHFLDCLDIQLAHAMGELETVVRAPWALDQTPAELADVSCLDRGHNIAAYVSIHRAPSYAAAHDHLQAARAHPLNPVAAIEADVYEGVLERRLGRFDESLSFLARAEARARWMHLDMLHAIALAQQAVIFAELGRFADVEALAREAESRFGSRDALSDQIRVNVMWARILHREEQPRLPDPTLDSDALIERLERRGDAVRVDAVRLNVAIAASQSDDAAEAARVLSTVDRRHLNDIEQTWAEIVTARVASHHGRFDRGREQLERARLLAELTADPALVQRVHLARAELETRAGDDAAARAAFEAADAIADGLALGLAPELGRGSFSAARYHGRARHIELLLALDDGPAALCTVLGARARHLRSLSVHHGRAELDPARRADQRALLARRRTLLDELRRRSEESWSLPADQLERLAERSADELSRARELASEAVALVETRPSPWRCERLRSGRDDEALLTMHPGAQEGRWWFLLDRAGEVRTVEVEVDPTAGERAHQLAAERALAELRVGQGPTPLRNLLVVPLGAMVSVDFHRIAIPGATPRVRYSLGLGAHEPETGDRTSRSGATAIVGATANLREAEAEVHEVRDALRRAGWAVEPAWAATAPHQPALLHYAGHGGRAGPSGWESYLDLAGGPVTSQLLVAYQRAPAVVVLGACEASASDPSVIDGGMNIASAFLLAGAELVIAPTGEIDDATARALARDLYRSLPEAPDAGALAEALVAALAEAQRRDDRLRAWRAWIP